FTETRPKPMIPAAGLPLLEYMVRGLVAAGVQQLLVVVNHKREAIQGYFQDGAPWGASIQYVHQERLDGIGGALRRCEPYLDGEPFLLVYGDVLVTGNPFSAVLRQYTETGGAVAALSLPPHSGEFGNVYLNPQMQITRLMEKPDNPHLSNYVLAGIYFLPPAVLGLLAEHQNDIEQVWQGLIQQGRLHGASWDGGWIDITRPWQILDANRMVMSAWDKAEVHRSVTLQGHVHIEGPVHVEAHVTIGSGTVLKGPCFIGEGTYVGNNTLIREYTALGPQSTVGYGTELKNCVLLARSQLGRLSYIGDSVIGEHVRLGTGVTTAVDYYDGRVVPMDTPEGPIPSGHTKLGAFIGDNA
ncbi:MAG TPA: sugar phosphate nucleotidyltransferase, partial [bacterium]|nr:sugar phosphate nucleotidyltransferase [bacterium]